MSLSRFLLLGVTSFLLTAQLLLGAPVITQVSPNRGPAAGETSVTITGSGFTGVTQVNFGPTTATFTFNSDTEITASAPKSVPGTVHISVTVGSETSPTTPADRYTYQGNWFAYVTGNGATPEAWYIDLSDKSTGNFSLLQQNTPYGIAITPDGRTAYVGNEGSSTPVTTPVNAIDLVNNIPTAIECTGHQNSKFLAISPDGSTVFLTFMNENTAGNVDVASNTYLGDLFTTQSGPAGIAMTPDGTKIYVANASTQTVTVYTVGGGTKTIALSNFAAAPESIAITPDGNEVYVTTCATATGNGYVEVISTASDTVIADILLPSVPISIAITPDGKFAYVTTLNSENIYQINTSTKNVTQAIPCNNGQKIGITIAPDGKTAYVVDVANQNVVIIDLTGNPPVVSGTIPLGSASVVLYIALTPDPAPAADFIANIGTAGLSTVFDASSSATGVGTIVKYSWKFGDGIEFETTDPITSHTYTSAGMFDVELTVTNSAGTSVTQTFTGQTVSNAGSYDNAHITKSVTIPPDPPPADPPPTDFLLTDFLLNDPLLTDPPPTDPPPPPPNPPLHFWGKIKKHRHHLVLIAEWTPSTSQNVLSYDVYKNSTSLFSTSILHFKKTLHPKNFYKHHMQKYKKHLENLYKVQTTDSSNLKSDFTPLEMK